MDNLVDQVTRHDPELAEAKIEYLFHATEEQMIRLIRALHQNPYVQKIDLDNVEYTPAIGRELALLFRENSVIEDVRLPFFMTNVDFLPVAKSLHENTTAVTTLDLMFCSIGGRHGGEIIRSLLMHNQSITKLVLSDNELGSEGSAGIAQALRSVRCRLKKLNLNWCNLGNEGARIFCDALKHNTFLEVLDIGNNRITFIGLRYVVDMLLLNSSLRFVSLRGNSLNADRIEEEPTAGETLANVLQSNTSLQDLDLLACHLTGADMTSVFQSLAGSNQTLSSLNIQDNRRDESLLTNLA